MMQHHLLCEQIAEHWDVTRVEYNSTVGASMVSKSKDIYFIVETNASLFAFPYNDFHWSSDSQIVLRFTWLELLNPLAASW